MLLCRLSLRLGLSKSLLLSRLLLLLSRLLSLLLLQELLRRDAPRDRPRCAGLELALLLGGARRLLSQRVHAVDGLERNGKRQRVIDMAELAVIRV